MWPRLRESVQEKEASPPQKGVTLVCQQQRICPGYQTAWCHETCGSRALLLLPDCETEASPDQMVSRSKLCSAFCHRVMSHQLQPPFVFHSLRLPPGRLLSGTLWRREKIHKGWNLLLQSFLLAFWQHCRAGKPVVRQVLLKGFSVNCWLLSVLWIH